MRAPRKKSMRRAPPAILSARLNNHVAIEARATGDVALRFNGISLALGKFSAVAAEHARTLRTGLALAAFASSRKAVDKEVDLLVRRLAARGLLEFRLARPSSGRAVPATAPAATHPPHGEMPHINWQASARNRPALCHPN